MNIYDKPTLFNQNISRINSYKLEPYKSGYKIPIVSDTMFHTMLNNQSRKKYVSYLISLILDKPYLDIFNSITFVKEKLDNDSFYSSKKCVDLVVEIDGEVINIEMNNNNASREVLERNLSYSFDLYKSKMKSGYGYNYQKTIQININNFSFEGNDNVIEKFMFTSNDRKYFLTEKIVIFNIYIPKIKEKYYNKDEVNLLETLLLVFNENSDGVRELALGDEIMEDYIKEAHDASYDDEIIGLYDKELHDKMMYQTGIRNAKEEGINQRNIEISKNLLKSNVPVELISDCTGLTIEEIENIEHISCPSDYDEIIGLYDKELHDKMMYNTGIRNAKEEGINQRNIEIVKKMLDENIDIAMIKKITGLSNDEINNLK